MILNVLFITLVDAYCERLLLCIDLKLGLKIISPKESPYLILQKIFTKKAEKPPLIDLMADLNEVSSRISRDVDSFTQFAREYHIRQEVKERVVKAKAAQLRLLATYMQTIDEDQFRDFD